jgi:hypothetical protein
VGEWGSGGVGEWESGRVGVGEWGKKSYSLSSVLRGEGWGEGLSSEKTRLRDRRTRTKPISDGPTGTRPVVAWQIRNLLR